MHGKKIISCDVKFVAEEAIKKAVISGQEVVKDAIEAVVKERYVFKFLM